MEPAFTAAIAYVLLGERLNGIQIAGSVIILGGVVFLRIYEGRLASQLRPEPQPVSILGGNNVKIGQKSHLSSSES
jgi:drug/metabolite transporter (DMT)-like permease